MATCIVCLDGTHQTKLQKNPTNIALLFNALGGEEAESEAGSFERNSGATGVKGKYLPGVGTQGLSFLRVLGNLFGDGIAESIIRGYTFLSRNYRPGDRIVITGFSRGATAARALAGWVVVKGLLDPTRYAVADKEGAYLRAIAAWYRYRKGRPDLADQERVFLIRSLLGELPELADEDFTGPVEISAVGVFDTVSSLGLPSLTAEGGAAFDFSICDTTLNDRVKWGFHALAADETRDLFAPTYWAQRDRIEQEAFPGAHSDVGGGFAECGLSDAALVWMKDKLHGAIGDTLFDLGVLTRPITPQGDAPQHDESMIFPFNMTPRRSRAFPHIVKPSAVLQNRLKAEVETLPGATTAEYQPKASYSDGSRLI